MKLNEIFEPQYSEINLNRNFNLNHDSPPQSTELGRGSFSSVQSTTDPHMVKKRQLPKNYVGMRDAFDSYAEIIVREKLWNMIHFPRIYVTKKYIDQDGAIRYQWQIEKLISYFNIKHEEMQNLKIRYFGKNAIYDDIVSRINGFILGEDTDIEDPTFKKACIKFRQIHKELKGKHENLYYDVRDVNIMFRRSFHGLELVFNDPFALN